MNDFEQRLNDAIKRGKNVAAGKVAAAQAAALTEEQFRRLHTKYRLELCDHIERGMAKLPDHFPGFNVENVVGDRGWGTAVVRDDVALNAGGRGTVYSRCEITVRPYSSAHVIDIAARGTIRNKEVFQRGQYQLLNEAQIQVLAEQIDLWILEYAELYAARV
jgi:hypothetical protein